MNPNLCPLFCLHIQHATRLFEPIMSYRYLKMAIEGQLYWKIKMLITIHFEVLFNWVRNNSDWQGLKILLLTWVYWLCIPVSTKANGLPPWFILNTSWTAWWVVEHRNSKKPKPLMAFSTKNDNNKTSKRFHREISSESKDYIIRFPRFIVLEAQDDPPLTNSSLFIIGKVITSNLKPRTIKKNSQTDIS